MLRSAILLPFAAMMAACQSAPGPTAPAAIVTLSDGERCTVVTSTPAGRTLSCPQRGTVSAPPAPQPALELELSDIPGVPSLPPVPQTRPEAACRAGEYVQDEVTDRVRGAVEGAVLDAAGLPGNTLGIIRRSQAIARRIEGRPVAAASAAPDPCDGL